MKHISKKFLISYVYMRDNKKIIYVSMHIVNYGNVNRNKDVKIYNILPTTKLI